MILYLDRHVVLLDDDRLNVRCPHVPQLVLGRITVGDLDVDVLATGVERSALQGECPAEAEVRVEVAEGGRLDARLPQALLQLHQVLLLDAARAEELEWHRPVGVELLVDVESILLDVVQDAAEGGGVVVLDALLSGEGVTSANQDHERHGHHRCRRHDAADRAEVDGLRRARPTVGCSDEGIPGVAQEHDRWTVPCACSSAPCPGKMYYSGSHRRVLRSCGVSCCK